MVPCPPEGPCHMENAHLQGEEFRQAQRSLDQSQNRMGIPGSAPKPTANPEIIGATSPESSQHVHFLSKLV